MPQQPPPRAITSPPPRISPSSDLSSWFAQRGGRCDPRKFLASSPTIWPQAAAFHKLRSETFPAPSELRQGDASALRDSMPAPGPPSSTACVAVATPVRRHTRAIHPRAYQNRLSGPRSYCPLNIFPDE